MAQTAAAGGGSHPLNTNLPESHASGAAHARWAQLRHFIENVGYDGDYNWMDALAEGAELAERHQSAELAEEVWRTYAEYVDSNDWASTQMVAVLKKLCKRLDEPVLVEIAERADWCASVALTQPQLGREAREQLAAKNPTIATTLAGNPAITVEELESSIRRWGWKHAGRILREALRAEHSPEHIRVGLDTLVEVVAGAEQEAELGEYHQEIMDIYWEQLRGKLKRATRPYPDDIHIAVGVRTSPSWVAAQRWTAEQTQVALDLCATGWEGTPGQLAAVVSAAA